MGFSTSAFLDGFMCLCSKACSKVSKLFLCVVMSSLPALCACFFPHMRSCTSMQCTTCSAVGEYRGSCYKIHGSSGHPITIYLAPCITQLCAGTAHNPGYLTCQYLQYLKQSDLRRYFRRHERLPEGSPPRLTNFRHP